MMETPEEISQKNGFYRGMSIYSDPKVIEEHLYKAMLEFAQQAVEQRDKEIENWAFNNKRQNFMGGASILDFESLKRFLKC